jgi:alpha-tubulin suppressor-like RCC1 family protein
VEGFEGVRVRRVFAGQSRMITEAYNALITEAYNAFAIGEAGELFSWGFGESKCLGRIDEEDKPWHKRVEALRGVWVSNVAVGDSHALALSEDGQVYAWGEHWRTSLLGILYLKKKLLPKPVEGLRGVRVGSIAVAGDRSYAVTDTGKVWAWGCDQEYFPPFGHGERVNFPLPKPIESLRGVKVDAVVACFLHTMALADDGSVYV